MHEWLENNSDCKGLEYLYTLTLIIPPDLLFRIMINYHVLRDKQTLHWVIKQLAYKFSLYFYLYHSLTFHLQKNKRERKYQIILWIYRRRIYSIENCESDNGGAITGTNTCHFLSLLRGFIWTDSIDIRKRRGPNSWVSVLLHSARLI